jgi:hypothetical protein
MSFIDESKQFNSPKKKKLSPKNSFPKYNSTLNKEETFIEFKNNNNNDEKLKKVDSEINIDLIEDKDNVKSLNTINEIFQFNERKNSNEPAYERLLKKPSFRKNLSLVLEKENKKEKDEKQDNVKFNKKNLINKKKRSIYYQENFMNQMVDINKNGFISNILKGIRIEENEIYGDELIGNAIDFVTLKQESLASAVKNNSIISLNDDNPKTTHNQITVKKYTNENLIIDKIKDKKLNKDSL